MRCFGESLTVCTQKYRPLRDRTEQRLHSRVNRNNTSIVKHVKVLKEDLRTKFGRKLPTCSASDGSNYSSGPGLRQTTCAEQLHI